MDSGEFEKNLVKCLKSICSEFNIRRVSCRDLGGIDHGVYIVISDNDYIIGYSRNLNRKLRMYCLGQLDSHIVVRLLMSKLDNLPQGILSRVDVISRRHELSNFIRGVVSSARILIIKCQSMGDKELYSRLKGCF